MLSHSPVLVNHGRYGADLVAGAIGEKRWASKEFLEAQPLDAIRGFFDSVGELWWKLKDQQITSENQAVKTPEGFVTALCSNLATAATVSGLPSSHPAFFVIVAVAFLTRLRNPNANASKVKRDFIRSYAVSFVRDGFGKVTGYGGGMATKTDVREIVMEAVVEHCGAFVDIGDENLSEAIRSWEKGTRTDKPAHLDMALPATCDRIDFSARCHSLFRDLAVIMKAAGS
ncbi:hypothetical protein ABMA32_13910 [Mesorhizobium sp. VNQ89]|uniref:hypothetical protein n=1 Tax=Mesorhizobium quangtriensis TaxID=3157709 RepID=UPI0032B7B88C